MNIIVTGGCGYIGSYLVFNLLKKKIIKKIFVIDNFKNGQKIIKSDKVKYYKICFSSKKVKMLIKKEKIDQIYHLAAYIDNEESVYNPKKYWINNLYKSKKLLSYSLNFVKIFNFASSAAVYGVKKNLCVKENYKTKPLTAYGKSKLFFEKELIKNKYKIKYNIFRFFNVAGADQENNFGPVNKNYKHLLNKLINAPRSFVINGNDYKTNDGTCVRDYIHIKDLIKIIIKISFYSKSNNILNVGSGIGSSVLKVCKLFTKLSPLKISFGPRRKGDNAYLISNNQKLKKKISIKFLSINKILKDLVKWKTNQKKIF